MSLKLIDSDVNKANEINNWGDGIVFKEYEEFKQAEAKINARIEELSQEISQKKTEREKVAAKYKKMMVDDSVGTKLYTTDELNQVKMRAEELASEIQVAEERLQMVKDGKSEKLEGLLVKVKKGWERETQKLNGEIQEIFSSAREHRAKLTIEIKKGHSRYLQAQELQRSLNEVERALGKDYWSQTNDLGVPKEPMVKEYSPHGYTWVSDKCVVPSEEELTNAYRSGELPNWVKHYAETGKLVTDDDLKPKQDKPVEVKGKSGGGLLGKLMGAGKRKVHTTKLWSPEPKKALEEWKRGNPAAEILETDQLSYGSGYEVRYTLPESGE